MQSQWVNISSLISVIVEVVTVTVISLIGYLIKRMIDANTETLRAMTNELTSLHLRNDVQDAVISQIVNEPFDSGYIVKHRLPIPKVKKNRRDS